MHLGRKNKMPRGLLTRRKGSALNGIGATLAYFDLEYFGDGIREPVFWYGVVIPVALLAILTLYLFWLDRKAGKLYRLAAKRRNRTPARKAVRKKSR
jgi:hypothetical protein